MGLASLDYHSMTALLCTAPYSLMCIGKHHSMARIDGSKRSSGLPSRRLRPASAASAVRALRRSRRERQLSAPPPLGCSVGNSRARRRMLLRAARRLCRSNYVVAPRTLMQKLSRHTASDRALYSRCGPKKVREQFTISAAPRGLPRALPQGRQKLLPRELHTHTRRTRDDRTAATHR